MTQNNDILRLEQLGIGYRHNKNNTLIANNLNLSLQKGSITCIIGKNGIGKSTLLKTITNIIPPIEGMVYLNQQSIKSYKSEEISKIMSVVFTEKLPPSNLTVYELVALGRQPYTNWIGKLTATDKDKISTAITYCHIEQLVHKKCSELSDGQLQRVMICRALAQDTALIVLDEPTSHLDIQHKFETFRTLKTLAHQLGKSILISTHEIQLALQMADKLWLMTSSNTLEGHPKALIENDHINSLFDSNRIYFDKKKEQFLMK